MIIAFANGRRYYAKHVPVTERQLLNFIFSRSVVHLSSNMSCLQFLYYSMTDRVTGSARKLLRHSP